MNLIEKLKKEQYIKGVNRSFLERYYNWIEKLKLNADTMSKDGFRHDNTYKSYVYRTIYFLEFLKNYKKHPFEFEPSDALEFQKYLQTREFTIKDMPMTNHYINCIMDAVKNLYNFFILTGVGVRETKEDGTYTIKKLQQNPFLLIPNLPVEKNNIDKHLTDEQIKELFYVAQNKMEAMSHYIVALLLGLYAGLRISEVVNIKKEDVSVNENDIIVIKVRGKGMKVRETIYVDNDTKEILLNYINKIPANALVVPASEIRLLKFCNRLSKKLSFKFTFHKLRHTFAQNLMDKGVPFETIGEIMGHSSLDTTRVYSKVTTEKAIKDIFRM